MSYLWTNIRHNLRTLHHFPLSELAGSLGDMGTLLPILVAMSKTNTISLPSTLIFSGLWNLLSGIIFGIPIVTQPMKAIAATSLHAQLTLQETMAAGLGVAAVVLLLSVTGLLTRLATLIPIPIIKGIQLGAGLSMILAAGRTLMKLDLSSQQWYDNNFWTLGAFVVLYGTSRYPHKVPFAILVFVLGVMVSGVRLQLGGEPLPSWGWEGLQVTVPSSMDFARGFGVAGLGQVPLTVLNSVVAVRYLSQDLLPEKRPPGIAALGVSVGVMNLVGCWFGAMPVCHGRSRSGGVCGLGGADEGQGLVGWRGSIGSARARGVRSWRSDCLRLWWDLCSGAHSRVCSSASQAAYSV